MTITQYADKTSGGELTDIFKILAEDDDKSHIAGDSIDTISHRPETIAKVHTAMDVAIRARATQAGQTFRTLDEVKAEVNAFGKALTGDGFYNPESGLGFYNDPITYVHANTPVMLGPNEQTGLYSSGGLGQIILDKKSRGLVAAGVTFRTFDKEFWNHDKIQMLEEASETCGFNAAVTDHIRDVLLYGGAVLYPIYKNDTNATFQADLQHLNLEKGCIDRWVNVDRWNTVVVPSFIVTAENYLRPEHVYLPLGGYAISSSRASLTRPKSMPYWAVLMNLGWSPSDYSGYVRSLYGYQMIAMSVPIMAQQLSLVANRIPLDSLTAALGKDSIEKLMKQNTEAMAEWSIINPKAINTVGELAVIERSFQGFDKLEGAAKTHLAASCNIPEPVLFHTPNKGFSDNTQESLLKNSESMKIIQRDIEPQLVNHMDSLIAHVWGMNSPEWEMRRKIWVSFDKPIVSTEKDLAEIGARYSATIGTLSTHMPTSVAVTLAQQFFTNKEIDSSIINDIKKYDEWKKHLEEEGLKQKQESGGMGHSLASTGNAANAGKFTKPK